jgi:Na+-translocating ferredoxin:NAD+ oxidoreductase subunit C
LLGRTRFHGGIHPPSEKERTAQLPIERFPSPPKVIIHLAQHVGVPANPLVRTGDRVRIGQMIGEPGGQLSASVHASIAGKVLRIDRFPAPDGRRSFAIEIENDGSADAVEPRPMDKSWREAALGELVRTISAAGIVGLGGRGVPTHVKLSPQSNTPVHAFIINAVESEPYLTADHRLALEKAEEILVGSLVIKKILGTQRTVIALQSSDQQAVALLSGLLKDPKYKDISLARLKPKYPQGAEKLLVQTLLNKQVPSGGSPIDVGCVVLNVATVYAVHRAIVDGVPLFQRVITVTGPAVRDPKNLFVPIGTPLRSLLAYCSFDANIARKVVLGGAMTGCAQPDLDVAVQKTTAGVVAFDRTNDGMLRQECINCGSCVKTCPMRLVPSFLAKCVGKIKIEDAAAWGITDCIECGSCAYVCPSKIDLVHFMKLGKYLVAKEHATASTAVGA